MIIDTKGKPCPEPLIIAKRALNGAKQGDSFEILSDNDSSCGNLLSYLRSLGFAPETSLSDGVHHITFTVGAQLPAVQSSPEPDSCPAPARRGGYAVVVRSDVMGGGDDQLGALLLRSCINSLGDLDNPPSLVVLYNGGVKLALKDTDTAPALQALSESGTRIMVCGTCVDYFWVREGLAVGEISNMLSINNALSEVSHIIYP